MKALFFNILVIVSGVVGWTFYSTSTADIEALETGIYLAENGGPNLSGGGAPIVGIVQYKEMINRGSLLPERPVSDVHSATVKLSENGGRVFEAYGVSGSIFTVERATSIDELPVNTGEPDLGLKSVKISGKVSGGNMLDVIDSTRSLLKKVPEFYIEEIKFIDGSLTVAGMIVGK